MSDAEKLTNALVKAGATREKVIEIIDGYGDAVDWDNSSNGHTDAQQWSLLDIIAEVWTSDTMSGDDPENWIINEICRTFNVQEVEE